MKDETNKITFKGTAEGLVIIIPEQMDTDLVIKQIGNKVKAAEKFFRGAKLKVLYRGKELTEQEEEKLKDVMVKNSGVIIESINYELYEPPIVEEKHTQASGIPFRHIFFKGLDEGPCKFVRGTIRSGTRVLYEGNVVIIGDANPGSEIVASGNVIVMGALRGMVHAGADGNRQAIVVALKLSPTQLRIGDIITRCPDIPEEIQSRPEMATVKDGVIYVEPL